MKNVFVVLMLFGSTSFASQLQGIKALELPRAAANPKVNANLVKCQSFEKLYNKAIADMAQSEAHGDKRLSAVQRQMAEIMHQSFVEYDCDYVLTEAEKFADIRTEVCTNIQNAENTIIREVRAHTQRLLNGETQEPLEGTHSDDLVELNNKAFAAGCR